MPEDEAMPRGMPTGGGGEEGGDPVMEVTALVIDALTQNPELLAPVVEQVLNAVMGGGGGAPPPPPEG